MGTFWRLAIIAATLALSATANAQDGIIASGRVLDTAAPASSIRILIDLGGVTDANGDNVGASNTTSPQSDGRYWNTLGAPMYTDGSDIKRDATYSAFVDTAGNTVEGMSVSTGGNAYNWYGQGVNTSGGNASGVGDYPASATVDSWIVQNTTTQNDGEIIITLPAGSYKIKFWGARATSGTITSNLTYHGTTKSYNASNNSTYTNGAAFDVTSDGTTPLTFAISSAGSSNNFAYYSVIDIKSTQ